MPLTPDDLAYLTEFYRAFDPGKPLPADDERYVALDTHSAECVGPRGVSATGLIEQTITLDPDKATAQLLSGSRGAGKSTELSRLAHRLEQQGFTVLSADAREYLTLVEPLNISHLLLVLAGAFGEKTGEVAGGNQLRASIWQRLTQFLKSEVTVTEASFNVGLADVKASLRTEAPFKKQVQKALAGRLHVVVGQVHDLIAQCVAEIRAATKVKGIVFLFDSLEQLRGTSLNAPAVYQSVETVFASHADALHLPQCHVVYTVPPWLGVLNQQVGSHFDSGRVRMLPMTRLWERSRERPEHKPGFDCMREVVERRGDWKRLLGKPATLHRLIAQSGGYLRDLFLLLREVVRLARMEQRLPASKAIVDQAISLIARDYQRISDQDREWLKRIGENLANSLPTVGDLPRLAALFENHLILCYHNGEEWFDVHPLVRSLVLPGPSPKGTP